MHFRLEETVRGLWLDKGANYFFDYGGPHALTVSIRPPTPEEQTAGHRSENAFCTATATQAPSDKNLEVFGKIAANQILIHAEDDGDDGVGTAYNSPNGGRIRIPALAAFPQHFQSFADAVRSELSDIARRTALVLRWRADAEGPHDPFSSAGMSWSTDRGFWHPMPSNRSVLFIPTKLVKQSGAIAESVQGIVAARNGAPLHHALFLEAWGQYSANPRSAIVVGMAAAELAVKHCIAVLVPGAEWLATNIPTPPLEKILREYLPLLPARHLIDGNVKPPPKGVMETLKKAVTIRNSLAHAGTVSPTRETAEQILKAIRDLLWLLDYYGGHEWAFDYISQPSREALQAEA
jgi:hypothetical protein